MVKNWRIGRTVSSLDRQNGAPGRQESSEEDRRASYVDKIGRWVAARWVPGG